MKAAMIWGEIGEVENFRHPDQLVAFSGFDPKAKKSGKKEVVSGPNFWVEVVSRAQENYTNNPKPKQPYSLYWVVLLRSTQESGLSQKEELRKKKSQKISIL